MVKQSLTKFFYNYLTDYRKGYEQSIVPNYELDQLIRLRLKSLNYYELLDPIYYTTNRERVKQILSLLPVKHLSYVKDKHDCENFALAAMTIVKLLFPHLPFGYVHVKRADGVLHAMNIIFYRTNSGRLTFEYYEPQTGKTFYPQVTPYFMII